jgi:MFS family permease
MQIVTVPYVLYELTRSAAWVGIGATASALPSCILSPIAGVLADRFDRRRILIAAQGAQLVAAFALWLIWVTGNATPIAIVCDLVVAGVAGSIGIASWQSLVPLLVPEAAAFSAVRLNSMQFSTAKAFGPALGTVVLVTWGAGPSFLVNGVTFVGVVVVLLSLPAVHTGDHSAGRRITAQLAEGARYTWNHSSLRQATLTITAVSFTGTAVVQLAPAIASRQFDVGRSAYGALVTAYGVMGLIGAIIASATGDRVPRSTQAATGLCAYLVGMGLLQLAGSSYAVGLISFGVMGLAYPWIAITLTTALQAGVVDAVRGRVVSIYLMGIQTGTPLGVLLGGVIADHAGIRWTTASFGVLLALIVVGRFAVGGYEDLNFEVPRAETWTAPGLGAGTVALNSPDQT